MAKGFKHGAGGGSSLNFKVVGNPQPENPKENTVWINTDEKITSYIFSRTQPTGSKGMVWVFISPDSRVPFNALRNNDIQVYPMNAKQYVNDAWVDVTAKTYQNGAWVDWWNGELFNNGQQYEHVTGGWVKRGYQLTTADPTGGTVTIGTTLYINSTGGSEALCASVGTVNQIDLTEWSKITCASNQSIVGGSGRPLLISKSTSGIPFAASSNAELDVSGVTGSYYVGSYTRQWQTNNLTEVTLKR